MKWTLQNLYVFAIRNSFSLEVWQEYENMKKKDLVFDQSKVIISKVAQTKIVVKKVVMAKRVEGSTATKK